VVFLYLLLFIIAFNAYHNRKYVLFLTCVYGLLTKFFMLDTSQLESIVVSGNDIALVLFLVLLPVVNTRNADVFKIRGDSLTKWVYIFLSLYVIELLLTVVLGNETLINSIKVIRSAFILVSFFVFRSIPIDAYSRFLKIALWMTLIQGVLFYLQFTGIRLLSGAGYIDDFVMGNAGMTAINHPVLAVFFVYYVLKAEYMKERRLILFLFLISTVFLTFVRGSILGLMLGLAYLVVFHVNGRKRVPIMLAFLIVIPISLQVINMKSDTRHGSGLDEIGYIVGSRNNLSQIDESNGTLAFRVAMLTERVVYLIDNPEYLLTGVGTMHEDSPRTLSQFHFQLGSTNMGRFYGRTIIESGDIAWVPIVLRYGLLGTFIHVMMFLTLFNRARKRNDILVIIASVIIFHFVRTFDGAFFELPTQMYFLSLYYAMISRSELEKKELFV